MSAWIKVRLLHLDSQRANYNFLHREPAQCLRLLEDGLRGFLLLVRRVAMLAQHALHQVPQVRPHVLPLCPVDGHVVLHGLHQLLRDLLEGRLAQDLHCAVVGLQGVVESERERVRWCFKGA